MTEAAVTAVAWGAHAAIYPAFAWYWRALAEHAWSFEDYIEDMIVVMEDRREGLDHLECSRA